MRHEPVDPAVSLGAALVLSAWLSAGCEEPPREFVHVERLTSRQIANSMTDLSGLRSPSLDSLPGSVEGLPLVVSALDAEVLRAAADETSAFMAADLDAWARCADEEDARACAFRMVHRLGPLVLRSPVPSETTEQLLDLFDAVAPSLGYQRGVEAVISALLQSPGFVYRLERSTLDEAGVLRIDDYAIASRISYFVWDSIPDRELLDAAASGALREPERRVEELDRMLVDPRAASTFVARVREWLGVDLTNVTKDPARYPLFDPASLGTMSADLDAFIESAGWGDGGSFHRMLKDPVGGSAEPGRFGVFMMPAVLTGLATSTSSSPVLRGRLVKERLFCESIASPPAGLAIMVPEPSVDATTRQRYEIHAREEPCATCHDALDPLGFAFEHYDAVGMYRQTENGLAIDASGTARHAATGTSLTFQDAVDLLSQLDETGMGARCWARYWAELAFGRSPSEESMQDVEAELFGARTSTPALFRALVRSPAFIEPHREQEGSP